MTPAQEAAAMWGVAENLNFSTRDRLAAALKALEYYGAEERSSAVEGCMHEHHIAECADCGAKPLQGLR